MNLSNVSRTAIFTLIVRDIMVKKKILKDPMAVHCLERIIQMASAEDKKQITKMIKSVSGIGFHEARSNGDRALLMDNIVNDYISANPDCTVINLACGFDTRYWRIDNKKCRYIEVDLAEVVALKRDIFKDQISYDIIGCSVLDYSWIDKVTDKGNKNFLLIAEGLLMYFPEQEAIKFLQMLSRKFTQSRFIFDMLPKYLTKGFWRIIIGWLSKKYFGFTAYMEFGFNKPGDIEAVSPGFKVIENKKVDIRSIIYTSIN